MVSTNQCAHHGNGITSLNGQWEPQAQLCSGKLISCRWHHPVTEFHDELFWLRAERSKSLDCCHRDEDVVPDYVRVFGSFGWFAFTCCRPCLRRWLIHVAQCHNVRHCSVPYKKLAVLPKDLRHVIRAFSICPEDAAGLSDRGNSMNYVVRSE